MKYSIVLLLGIAATILADPLIPYQYQEGEISKRCDKLLERAKAQLDEVAALEHAKRNFANTIEAMENISAELNDRIDPLIFMAYVSTDKKLREEASVCEEKLSLFSVEQSLRKDLYIAFVEFKKNYRDKMGELDKEQMRLIELSERSYRKLGMSLPDEQRAKLQELKKELSSLETQFSKNLVEVDSVLHFSQDELSGTPDSFRSRLQKGEDGKYIVTTKYPDYSAVMRYAKNPAVREKMLQLFYNRAAPDNTKLLEKAIAIRHQIAQMLGYETWADYRTDGRMAKNAQNVREFLASLQTKLALKNREDLAELLEIKKKDFPQAQKLDLWDIGYYSTQLKKQRYQVDDEEVRQYFPVNRVVNGTFEIYSRLLGVKFRAMTKADTWHKDVKLYEIIDEKSQKCIAYFYADLYPRPGKYGHAAAFTLRKGRKLPDGSYQSPISAIVANLEPPAADAPSLLPHRNVETFFHEFGHIMHQTLTTAAYGSFSGTSVSRDFVEAPSQMLENWIWDSAMLDIISGHYEDESKKLPTELKEKLLQLAQFQAGISYTRQVFYATLDLVLHTSGKDVDALAVYDELFRKIVALEPAAETQWLAGFGHLMGGYDAGYYGYLWSQVYAQDMFTKFAENGLLDASTGMRYRSIILERGGLQEPEQLIREFLEREPNNKAFLGQLGIK